MPQIRTEPDRAEFSVSFTGDLGDEFTTIPLLVPFFEDDKSIVAVGNMAPGAMLFPSSSNEAEKKAPLDVVAREGFWFECEIIKQIFIRVSVS